MLRLIARKYISSLVSGIRRERCMIFSMSRPTATLESCKYLKVTM